MRRTPMQRRQRGLSLVEAMVAMAVMGFGTLAVLGVQASLRLNGDIAKQRSEAVRIAQETLENSRAFADLDAFTALASDDGTAIDGYTTNTSYTATLTVFDPATDIEDASQASTLAPQRTTSVVVSWTDRAGLGQSVELHTTVTGVAPVLAGSLAVPADNSYVRNPGGRSPVIPRTATPQSDGTSRFSPPGSSGGLVWVFDNNTGFITQVCTGTGDGATCIDFNARLLAGYIRFALDGEQPTPQQAEVPPSPRPAGLTPGVQVLQTYPLSLPDPVCYTEQTTAYVAYYCAVPMGVDVVWTGRSELVINDGEDSLIASDIDDDDNDEYKVCRYTAYRDHRTVPTNMSNEQHPREYVQVRNSLVNQNFLVIRAGDGDDPFSCPDDDTSTSFVNGRTWHHQPHE